MRGKTGLESAQDTLVPVLMLHRKEGAYDGMGKHRYEAENHAIPAPQGIKIPALAVVTNCGCTACCRGELKTGSSAQACPKKLDKNGQKKHSPSKAAWTLRFNV